MKKVQYSQELLKDFDSLIKDFYIFMTFNLIHADKNLSSPCREKINQLVQYSLSNSKILIDFFDQPVLRNEIKNREKLEKNIQNLTNFFYEYLRYAELILKKCRSDIYSGRFSELQRHYLSFCGKYFS